MSLTKSYPADFERVWQAYPSWPKGRSVKKLAHAAFEKAKKYNGWTPEDIDELVLEIENQKRRRKSWQRGDNYGPQALQVWLNQNGWDHDYPLVQGGTAKQVVPGRGDAATDWEKRDMSQAEWEAEQDWIARDQMKMEQKYPTKEAAIAAAALREMGNGTRH